MSVERHEILGGEIARNRYGEREYEGIPVRCKCLARITYVADTRHIGGKDRHSHYPARNGVSRRRKLISRTPLPEERTSEDNYSKSKNKKYYEVNYIQSSMSNEVNT